uniref:Fibronectin type III domain containing 4 n=1 Tax=Fundulus heteroclitus TaxID=8078 RepID=A0A3Q2QXR6_FUNHE
MQWNTLSRNHFYALYNSEHNAPLSLLGVLHHVWQLPLNTFHNCLKHDGHMQRFIREVNTTSRSCVLWDLEEETDYIIQVQSIGLYGESQASKKIHFRTLKKTDRFSTNNDPTVQGLDMSRHLQTGEMIIIVVVLVMWAAVIALFCRQYDIIKDNDSSNNKEKVKPLSERSTPEHHSGGLLRSKVNGNEKHSFESLADLISC